MRGRFLARPPSDVNFGYGYKTQYTLGSDLNMSPVSPSKPRPASGQPPDIQEDFVVSGQDDQVLSQAREASGGKIAGRAGLVGILTLVSRFFGLARDAVIAYVLGTKAAADAFYVAFRIPNLLRRMFAEGNLTLSFVPVFTEAHHRSHREAKEVADVTFTLITLLLAVITLAGVFGAAFFVKVTAWGFTEDPAKFALTVKLTRITFPYIFLVTLGALMMGILNSRKHFTAPALSPVLLNIGIILGALALSPFFETPAVGIAWGVLLGGTLQLLIQVPVLIKYGFFPRFNFNIKIPAVRKILRLMLPTLWGSAVYQFNLLAITFMASFLPTGSISFLWYADRVIEFPLGVFAISLATVVLPTLSDHAARKDQGEMKRTLRKSLSLVWLLNIPAAVGLAVLAEPILALLFYRGDFGVESTQLTAQAVIFFAIGLPFVSATRITASAFYAVQEAKKPVIAANLSVLVTVVSGALLLFPMKHRGLALAVSLGSITNFIFIMSFYRKKMGSLGGLELFKNVIKIFLAAGVMAGVLWLILQYWNLSFAPFLPRLGFVLAMIGAGAVIYGLLVRLFRVEGTQTLLRLIKRK